MRIKQESIILFEYLPARVIEEWLAFGWTLERLKKGKWLLCIPNYGKPYYAFEEE